MSWLIYFPFFICRDCFAWLISSLLKSKKPKKKKSKFYNPNLAARTGSLNWTRSSRVTTLEHLLQRIPLEPCHGLLLFCSLRKSACLLSADQPSASVKVEVYLPIKGRSGRCHPTTLAPKTWPAPGSQWQIPRHPPHPIQRKTTE